MTDSFARDRDGDFLANRRIDYAVGSLDASQLEADPITQFRAWLSDELAQDAQEPNAMTLATVDEHGRPRQRTVLLKYVTESGFQFFTNYGSDKARQIAERCDVSLSFRWSLRHRQVSVVGKASKLDSADSEAYFRQRPRGSQLAALVSPQSRVIKSREWLEERYRQASQRYGGEVPFPSNWGGYLVEPDEVEFWQGRSNRLHDRFVYRRDGDGQWVVRRLAP